MGSGGVRLSFAGFVLCVVIVALGPAVSARAGVIGTVPAEKCNEDGRRICLTVKTFENITASDPARQELTADGNRFTWVEWEIKNGGGSQLTHPTVTVSFADNCGVDPEVASCTDPASSTAAFVPELPSNCSPEDSDVVCTYPNLPSGVAAAVTRLYFKTADLPATSTDISVTAEVNERANDGNPCEAGDPNCDTFTSTIRNSYEPELDAAYTHALTGNRFHLPTDDGLSSFNFTSASPSIFFTTFKKLSPLESAALCFSSVVCFDRALFANTQNAPGFSDTNPVVFYTRLLDPPGGVTTKSLNAIHFYDPVSFTSAANRLTPGSEPSFARMDGLRLDAAAAAALGIAAGKYFVVQHLAGDNSFRLSLTAGGAPIALAAASGVQGEPIRIIGDQGDERSTTSCTTTYSAGIPVPSICVKKVPGSKALDSWVWDRGNGFVNW